MTRSGRVLALAALAIACAAPPPGSDGGTPDGSASGDAPGLCCEGGLARTELRIQPDRFDFGSHDPGIAEPAVTFSTANLGVAPSSFLSFGVTGAGAADFVLDATGCTASRSTEARRATS